MKKFKRYFIVILLILSMVFLLSCGSCVDGCIELGMRHHPTEWDGKFLYYYVEREDCYAIVGTKKCLILDEREDKEEPKDVIFIPTHYKGKPIKYTCYILKSRSSLNMEGGFEVGIRANANKIYLSYLVEPYPIDYHRDDYFIYGRKYNKEIFIVNTNYEYFKEVYMESNNQYYTKYLYDIIVDNKKIKDTEFQVDNSYSFTRYSGTEYKRKVIAANTAYMFNYEDSPNEDYFFINNFERGGKIENTPYEPIRDGYTFTGWYKDEDCTEKWNFETDILPMWEYDEDGNEIYVETKLYAGWSKK